MDTLPPNLFAIEVLHDAESGMWVATCDQIGLVTEADSFEALEQRVLLIGPELAVENGQLQAGSPSNFIFQHLLAAA